MASPSAPAITPSTILRHQYSIFAPMAMLAGMQLDVFTQLKDGPLTAAEIAEVIGVQPSKLTPLLYALVAAELLTVQGDHFGNTPEADTYLVLGRPAYVGSGRQEFYADIWQALLKTAASIRSGTPQHKHDFYAMSEEEMGAFFRGQHLGAVTAGAHLTTIHDFSHFRHMLDVGGGSGGISIGACRSCPQLISTVVDLPRVIPVTRKFLDESEVADRVTTAVADVVTESPEGTFDVAVMRNLIQVLSLEDAQAAVCNVAQCLIPGGTLFIVGGMLDDSHRSPVHLVGQNLVHLNIYDDGLIYTEGEYRSLLVGSGFADIEVRREGMPNNQSLISARKPGEAA
jgi:2-hydroxy-4-(methylsulfanyl)butanoate S-methyltransferase